MTSTRTLLMAAALVAGAAPVRAQPPADPGSPQARAAEHLRIGLERYQASDYEGAIEEFRAGLALDPRREFLFALGQAERLSGDCRSAILYYQAFVRAGPTPTQAAAAREQIEVCHLAVAAEPPRSRHDRLGPVDRDPPPPPPTAAAPVVEPREEATGRPPPWYRDRTGDLLLGGGAVAALVAGGFWLASVSASDAAGQAATYPEYDQLIGRARTRRTMAVATAVAGGVLVGAAVWRFRWGRGGGRAEVSVAASGERVGLALGGRF